ncbi:hypothetical protein [Winogradskyella poriferorum]|uniref:hypothetical protein n=1 Tax=Winogradskyella poriferorum TaxID=307627 RepID=UPI003D646703
MTGFANKRITEDNGAIPPDFGNGETTMFFITHHRSYNKYLEKNVEKIYKGDYLFIEHVDLIDQSDKYDDKDKYRYVFNYEYVNGGTSAVNPYRTTQEKEFYILDRKTNLVYKSPYSSASWSRVQKVYLKKLNKKMGKD